jgi:hypothetical protein
MKGAAVRYHWSAKEYRRRLIQDYAKLGIPEFKGGNFSWYINKYFYDYFTAWKDKTPYDKEYESPKTKSRIRYKDVSKPQKTMRQAIQQQLDINASKQRQAIGRKDQVELRRLQRERDGIQKRLG